MPESQERVFVGEDLQIDVLQSASIIILLLSINKRAFQVKDIYDVFPSLASVGHEE